MGIKPIRKLLFNPGPSTTTQNVKLSQVVSDICPREKDFIKLTNNLRKDLLKIVNKNNNDYTSVLFGGSGTAAMEATISSVVDRESSLLIIINGAYGKRMESIAKLHSIDYVTIEYKWGKSINFEEVERAIINNSRIRYIAMVHHETTTGILNDIQKFSNIGRKYNKKLIIDTISSFAGIEINLKKTPIDYLMSTSNKCIQGMAGISFVIFKKDEIPHLEKIKPRSYYLSLYDEYMNVKSSGESRFTPPVQVAYALRSAIDEFFNEGLMNRYERYKHNYSLLREGLSQLGFKFLLNAKDEAGILLAIKQPTNLNYSFTDLHDYLFEHNITIYPGKITDNDTFRLSIIGDLYEKDIDFLIKKLNSFLISRSLNGNLYNN